MLRNVLLALVAAVVLGQPSGAQTGSSASASMMRNPNPQSEGGAYNMLVDFTHGFMTVQTQYSANIISETLSAGLQRSRDTVRANSKPMPEEVKQALMPFYPAELLENVRYAIGDTSPSGLAGFAIRNGNAAAVTLIDTVVFKEESYVGSLALWAHEIHHVQQYTDWGVGGFAQRYAFGWTEVEAEASARAKAFVAWYRERNGVN